MVKWTNILLYKPSSLTEQSNELISVVKLQLCAFGSHPSGIHVDTCIGKSLVQRSYAYYKGKVDLWAGNVR